MKIVILNTGCANLFSIFSAIKRLGYNPIISYNKNILLNADKILLPGVGNVKPAMEQLYKYKLVNLIKSYTKPVLGICLGMQILGSISDENQNTKTLNIIDHPVIKMSNIINLPLPHIGWNKVNIKENHYLFNGIINNSYFYFVHNYMMSICNYTIAEVNYDIFFTAAIEKNNFIGVQFHPERSGKVGRQLLKNFLEI